jgi:hypothetical protein
MELFHHVSIFIISEEEKARFAEIGVRFSVGKGLEGLIACFDILDSDPRWPRVVTLLGSLEARQGRSKAQRALDLSMPWEEAKRGLKESQIALIVGPGLPSFNGYSGQSTAELLELEGKCRSDSLVLAFEEAIQRKAERDGLASLTEEERIVLAVEALEREVNNGGYDQFLINSSREFAPNVVDALEKIGCTETARITRKALRSLGSSQLTTELIDLAMQNEDTQRDKALEACSQEYFDSAEPIAERLLVFLKANPTSIQL